MHFRADRENRIAGRGKLIAASIDQHCRSVKKIVLAITGDIAFSGKREEYDVAGEFLNDIRAELEERNHEVRFFAVPGNHDCNFDDVEEKEWEQRVDDILERGVITQEDKEYVIKPQKSFMDFQKDICTLQKTNNATLFWMSINDHNHSILFRGYNTALLSRKHEQQGKLMFSIHTPGPSDSHEVTINLTHHPLNWIKAELVDELRKEVENTSTIILTGHEHSEDSVSVKRDYNEAVCISAGPLQDGDQSVFSIITLDFETNAADSKTLGWSTKEQTYTVVNESGSSEFALRGLPRLRAEFKTSLNAMDSLIHHPIKGSDVRLDELFVYPAFSDYTKKMPTFDLIGSDEAKKNLLDSDESLLITGKDRSGKTALARTLFTDFRTAGDCCLLISGKDIKSFKAETIGALIDRKTEEQYFEKNRYLQLKRNSRILIVDDLDTTKLKIGALGKCLEELKKHFKRIVLLASSDRDVTAQPEMVKLALDQQLKLYSIRECSSSQTYQIISKWQKLGREHELTDDDLAIKCKSMQRRIDEIRKNQLVQFYPEVLIQILVIIDSGVVDDELRIEIPLILEQIVQLQVGRIDGLCSKSIHTTILSSLAFDLFSNDRDYFDMEFFCDFVQTYNHEYGLSMECQDTIKKYLKGKMIEEIDQRTYRFRNTSTFSYFVSSYISKNFDECLSTIDSIFRDLSRKRSRNVLTILCSIVEDVRFTKLLVEKADELLCEEKEFVLENEVTLNPMDFLDDINIGDSRPRANLEIMQRFEESLEPIQEEQADLDVEDDGLMKDMMHTLAIIKAIGLRIKSFVGSTRKQQKRFLIEHSVSLGLRLTHSFIDSLVSQRDRLVAEFEKLISSSDNSEEMQTEKRLSPEEIVDILYVGSVYWLLKEISISLASRELRVILNEISSEDTTREFIAACCEMYSLQRYPQDSFFRIFDSVRQKRLPVYLIKLFTMEHFLFNESPRELKQRVADKLTLRFQTLVELEKKKES